MERGECFYLKIAAARCGLTRLIPKAVGAVFAIDLPAKIRTILCCPLSIGRNLDEMKRIILALQKLKANQRPPADWRCCLSRRRLPAEP
ncbi:hypothetical protein H8705_03220 [Oscillospiraceae bacterium NSJ-64]|uniref:Uncharacterized protein n=1 Tax=Youxingia wuxianensis TaxID=2763678 RepID=A0A926EQ27_9FIRM|nr:hypothetical protein [Youxingia wuxianensis]